MAFPDRADVVGWAAESFRRPPMICVAPRGNDRWLWSWNEAHADIHLPEAVKGVTGLSCHALSLTCRHPSRSATCCLWQLVSGRSVARDEMVRRLSAVAPCCTT